MSRVRRGAASAGGPGGSSSSRASTDEWLHVALPSTSGDVTLYNSVRIGEERLDSSPFTLTLRLAPQAVAAMRGNPTTRSSGGGSAPSRGLSKSDLSGRVFVEPVLWRGTQATAYSDDDPHDAPLPPLHVSVTGVTEQPDGGSTVVLAVQRALPLSSAYAGARFRLAVLLQPPYPYGGGPGMEEEALAGPARHTRRHDADAGGPGQAAAQAGAGGGSSSASSFGAGVESPSAPPIIAFSEPFRVLAK